QDGADSPSLRADRVERAQGHHPVRDCRDRVRVVQPDDGETSVSEYDVQGKRGPVVGAARSGIAAAELLARRRARVTLTEMRPEVAGAEPLRRLGVQLELGGHRDETLTDADLIVLSPGVPPDLPVIQEARERGGPVLGELELASRWLSGRVVAITGTKGKSTTTALTGQILEAAGYR